MTTATRDYARSVESGVFERMRPTDLARLAEAMGPDLWAWQYAKRLTRQLPWRARADVDERVERAVAAQAMIEGIETWERALAALDERIEQARVQGWSRPEPLAVPAVIVTALEARRAATLDRIARKRGRSGEAGTGAVAIPDAAVHHPPFPAGRA
ncbi:hypothetical protein [Methylobacterium sp. J-068]|uniref:hypothetical protein n=1 Tax=Methylobacterium sp. J-068 TaxID=2836649 RepID=UPI001FBB5A18|nr:hypothetical protein [Methylobacterium sp. J-068]MCJ2036143.1 hypothetical protein [Methylobacterium sp. J-068]